MKKLIKRLLCLVLITVLVCTGTIAFASESNQIKAFGATYEFVSNVKTVDLGYGIKHIKDVAKSTKTSDGELLAQSVNILEIPSVEDVRIVNWALSSSTSWTKQTVRAMAKDFEDRNPGWVVVAAINGDFFDIKGNNKALPYQTNGVTVSNGETYRPFTNLQTIGFKNDGSSYSLVADKKFEVSNHFLNIYDENGNIIYEKEVKYFNQSPEDGEVAIWYTYNDANGIAIKKTLPGNNTYLVKAPIKLLPMSDSNVYAKGVISSINQETEMFYGQFGIETNNQEIKNLLKEGVTIRIQQNLIGDYAECTDITGGGVTLVKNGEAIDNTADTNTHPRTCVGIKEDGTIVFMTVDGRQALNDMNGMAYNELSATLLYYGCYEAYNLDGGGSTTLITRNEFGDFDVQNSPSDGGERNDSNSLLVVVPEISLKVNSVSDTEVVIDYNESKDNNIKISDIKVSLNGETRIINEYPYTWSGLNPTSKYDITAAYTITYKNTTKEKEIFPIQITTGNIRPTLGDSYYFIYNDKIYIKYSILNPNNIKIYSKIVSGKSYNDLTKAEGIAQYDINKVDKNNVSIKIGYNLLSSVSEYEELTYVLEERDVESVKKKITLNLNGGKLDVDELYYIPGVGVSDLPTPKKMFSKFVGWQYNGNIIKQVPRNIDENIELTAIYSKGCSSNTAQLLIQTLGLLSLAIIIIRKK